MIFGDGSDWWFPEVDVDGFRIPTEVQRIVFAPVDVTGLIGTEDCENFVTDLMRVCLHSPNGPSHCNEIMKDKQIRDEMIVFDELALFVPDVLSDHAIAPE